MREEFEAAARAIREGTLSVDLVDAAIAAVDLWTQRRLRERAQVPQAEGPVKEGYPAPTEVVETDPVFRRRQAEAVYKAVVGYDQRWWRKWASERPSDVRSWIQRAVDRATELLRRAELWSPELDRLQAELRKDASRGDGV